MSIRGIAKLVFDRISGKEPKMLEKGSAAPEFEAPDQNGKTHKLSDYRGRKVVLWFFPKADTPG